jgi:hypothetical protein
MLKVFIQRISLDKFCYSFLEIYDAYEIEVKTPYGFEQSSVIISCEISPPLANSYINIIGWLEKVNNEIFHLDLRKFIKNRVYK